MSAGTYGSLMYPRVMEALTKHHFSFEDITLLGFERRAILGKKYPGLRQNSESSVNGRIWFEVDEASTRILDRFEDPLYERRTVEILSSTRGLIEARAYVVPAQLEHTLAEEPWDQDSFEKIHLAQYVLMCGRFRADVIGKNEDV